MYACPNCRANVGYLGDSYLCPTTRTAAPPHLPIIRRTKPAHPDASPRTDRGHRARKRARTKRPPIEVPDDLYDTAGIPADA